jgi:hypothetical protein
MHHLEISSVSAACGKNQYEPRSKVMLTLLCKKYPDLYKDVFIDQGIIQKMEPGILCYDTELKSMYKEIKRDIKDPKTFEGNKKRLLDELKQKPDVKESDITYAEKFLESSMKKDCGTNNESAVISKKMYKKGNNRMYSYSEDNWIIKGFHDATDKDIVIEIKTRMKPQNVRKNEYDLYQLFGYLLVMRMTKGKIVQYYKGSVYDSDIPTEKEYGIIDINFDPYKSKFETFTCELRQFFIELESFIPEPHTFNFECVFKGINLPIATYDTDGIPHNVNPNFEKILNIIFTR